MISEFVSVKAKMYSYLAIDGEKQSHTSKGKGVPKPALKKVHHQKYLDCIYGVEGLQKASFNRISSTGHEIKTVTQSKISLCATDEKRFYLDPINSRAIGHYRNEM